MKTKPVHRLLSLLPIATAFLALPQQAAQASPVACYKNTVVFCGNYEVNRGATCEGQPIIEFCITTDSYVHAVPSNYPSGTTLVNYYQAQCNYVCSWQDCNGYWHDNTKQTIKQETATFGPACTPPA